MWLLINIGGQLPLLFVYAGKLGRGSDAGKKDRHELRLLSAIACLKATVTPIVLPLPPLDDDTGDIAECL